MMIVFDFDKTLINKDTLFGFYKLVHGNNFLFKVKRLILIGGALIYKLKFIDNDTLKALGIKLFLNGVSINQLEKASILYAEQLELNQLYYDVFLKSPKDKRIIISASLEIYLKKVFPEERVFGTLLEYDNNRVKKLKYNCYGKYKLSRFKKEFPQKQIKEVYSDSNSDSPLFNESNQFYLVNNGIIQYFE